MAHAAKKVSSGTDESVDVAQARLVRRGPGRSPRLSLRTLREAAGKTQAQVSRASGLAQPEISKLEAASSLDDRMVATVRRYLAALGDELELVSVSGHGHRIGIASPHPTEGVSASPPESGLSFALVELWSRMHEFGAQSGRERWHEAARLLEAVHGALQGTGTHAVSRELSKPKIGRLRADLETAMATGDVAKADTLLADITKLSHFGGRDPVAVLIGQAADKLNENLTGKVRRSIPRLGERGPIFDQLRDHLVGLIKRGKTEDTPVLDRAGKTVGIRSTADAKRERNYTEYELAFLLLMDAKSVDPGGSVLPMKDASDVCARQLEPVIRRILEEHPKGDAQDKAERILVECARALGVKNPARLADAARKREERRADRG
jgi:transcriptional regulator with XRE-family HTH domain